MSVTITLSMCRSPRSSAITASLTLTRVVAALARRARSPMRAQELVESCRLACLVVALGEVRRVARRGRVEAGREVEVAVLLVEVGGHGIAPGHVPGDVAQRRQPGGRAVRLTDGDRAVEPHDGRVGEPQQLVVPL